MQSYQQSQSGLAMTSWLFIIVVALTTIRLGMEIVPEYLNNYAVIESLKSVAADPQFSEMPPEEVHSLLSKSFSINHITTEARESLNIERVGHKVLVTVNYEKRIPLLGNMDLVLTFNNLLDNSIPEKCCDEIE